MIKITAGVRTYTVRLLIVLGILALAFVILGGTSVAVWEYTNSNAFCANACHAVHPEEPVAHQYSRHTNVKCVECHLGRISTFEAVWVKSKHLSHVWSFLTGYDRPLTSYSMPVSNDSCESCHSPQPHRNNVLKVYHRFAEDEKNTETKVGLVLRHVGRQTAEQSGEGIQWHAENQIRYIATDPQKQNIPWVELTRADGEAVIYQDRSRPLSDEEIKQAQPRDMECDDCHNRAGHPFYDPELVLDFALAEGRLDRRFPFIKKRAKELLMQEFEGEEEAHSLVEAAWQQYQEDFPEVVKKYPEVLEQSKEFLDQRQSFMAELMTYSRFQEPGVSWRSFPENIGHKHSAGCFRCHDGNHRDAQSNPIPVNCTTCHSVPMPFKKGIIPQHLLNVINMTKPANHKQPDFMEAHWTKYVEACSKCHEKFSYGTEGKEFCANSSCHDPRWQSMPMQLKPELTNKANNL